MTSMLRTLAITFLIAASASAESTNVYISYGASQANRHGQAFLTSITGERSGFKPRLVTRWLPGVQAGMSLTYSDVRQPRSWFGHTFGDPDDRIRAEWGYLFLRREWRNERRVRPYIDLGSGPMWSNRRIPAATARFNFHSQLNLGMAFGTRHPLYLAYRFSHISNFEFVGRNPGWNVHTFAIGTRVSRR